MEAAIKPRRSVLKRQKKEAAKKAKQQGAADAMLKNVPTSPRKMRLVTDLIRGQKVDAALAILKYSAKHPAKRLEKLLISAIANWQAKNEDQRVDEAELFVKEISVDAGRVLKRLRPAPQGRAYRVRKRSNHVYMVIDSLTSPSPVVTQETQVEEAKPEAKKKAAAKPKKTEAKAEKKETKKTKKLYRMGQKVNPVGLRLGIIKGWDSNWYGGKTFADKLVEDEKIRNYIYARIPKGGISKIVIERTIKRITLTINTARPGVVIGKGGTEVDKIKEELKKLTGKDVQINIYEIKRPELDAKLVGESIAQQLQARISYRRAMKQAIASTMRVGALGIKIKCSGRLGGAEMARTEQYKEGRIPLHTLRADIDYAISEALTVYGKIGIKVWIFKGEIYGKRDLSPNVGVASQAAEESGVASSGGKSDKPNRRKPDGGQRRKKK